MAERFPDEIPINGVKSSLKIHKVYKQWKVVFQVFMDDGAETIDLINARSVFTKSTLIIPEQSFQAITHAL